MNTDIFERDYLYKQFVFELHLYNYDVIFREDFGVIELGLTNVYGIVRETACHSQSLYERFYHVPT